MHVREPLSAVDAGWLRMDRPTNLMMICGMFMFAERVDPGTLKRTINDRMLCFHRFRQCVADHGDGPQWEIDQNFNLDWHVRHIALPKSKTGDALESVASDLISTPLDPTKPMWQFHLIDTPNGGSALVLRIHHCYGDGFALTHVVMCMTDAEPDDARLAMDDVPAYVPERAAWERIFGPMTNIIGDIVRSSLAAFDAGRDMLAHPDHAVDYARIGGDIAYQTAVIASMTPDYPTRLKGPLSIMKRVAWAETIPLLEVKALADSLHCSVNDVLVSCATGALRSFLLEQGDFPDGAEVRALVPVNLRPPGPITELGNHFGLVFLSLPIGIEDPFERIEEVKRRMDQLKHSQQPLVALGILAGMGVAPEFIKDRVLEVLAANASAVITNVRGSAQERYLAGKLIKRQMFWVPQSGGIGVGISLLSYAGEISFGLVTDSRRIPNPRIVVDRFVDEFKTLLLTSLMMPWPGEAEMTEV
ncbi:MAG TPA: wax ester/triacylglycerol synthase family O-acyltransferase [Burkholderiaceae bacterium]